MSVLLARTKFVGLILGPVLFALIVNAIEPGTLSEKSIFVLGMGAWMVSWWATEAMPIPITALLPMVIFPLAGVSSVREASAPYGDPVIFLFMGGFILALGLERHKLHQRIALGLIRLTGTSGNGIILGFMLSTALISMWISNTATAIMMLPIATSVTSLLASELGTHKDDPRFQKFATGLMLAIAYSASIGGMATIIGTPPNVVMVGFMKRFYNIDVSFTSWMIMGIPMMILALIACYLIITRLLFVNRLHSIEGSHELIQRKYLELGRLTKAEKLVLVVFSVTCFFWIFRQNLNNLIGKNLLDDTTIAIAGGILMFLMPVDLQKQKFLLEWNDMKELPWGILLLFGGGLCLADGMEKSGLVQIVGNYFSQQKDISPAVLIISLTAISMGLTELMSNVALVTIFVPVVFGIADGFHINPVWLSIPVTLAASCAFMMPISTPPNAVLFATGHIRMKDMIRTGILLNLACLVIISILGLTLIQWLF
ncbi:MAG: DASS family sodium-coupled anion symporter [Cyclobacteriaceae bacterium]|nr:DASS family sodium-coupled anion symporter [Cyclobacteriaceae bacterium]